MWQLWFSPLRNHAKSVQRRWKGTLGWVKKRSRLHASLHRWKWLWKVKPCRKPDLIIFVIHVRIHMPPLDSTFLCLHMLADEPIGNSAEVNKIIIVNSCGVLITVTKLDTHTHTQFSECRADSAFAVGTASGGFCSSKAGVCRLAYLVQVWNVASIFHAFSTLFLIAS